jgi:hypothetical protein
LSIERIYYISEEEEEEKEKRNKKRENEESKNYGDTPEFNSLKLFGCFVSRKLAAMNLGIEAAIIAQISVTIRFLLFCDRQIHSDLTYDSRKH